MAVTSGIVTSFSQAGARVVLHLPEHLSPEIIIALGHPASVQALAIRARAPVR